MFWILPQMLLLVLDEGLHRIWHGFFRIWHGHHSEYAPDLTSQYRHCILLRHQFLPYSIFRRHSTRKANQLKSLRRSSQIQSPRKAFSIAFETRWPLIKITAENLSRSNVNSFPAQGRTLKACCRNTWDLTLLSDRDGSTCPLLLSDTLVRLHVVTWCSVACVLWLKILFTYKEKHKVYPKIFGTLSRALSPSLSYVKADFSQGPPCPSKPAQGGASGISHKNWSYPTFNSIQLLPFSHVVTT